MKGALLLLAAGYMLLGACARTPLVYRALDESRFMSLSDRRVQFSRDNYVCQSEVARTVGPPPRYGAHYWDLAIYSKHREGFLEQCMAARGWVLEPE